MINTYKKPIILSVEINTNLPNIPVGRTPAKSRLNGRFFLSSRYKRNIGKITVMGQFEPVTFNFFRYDYVGDPGHHYVIQCDKQSLYWGGDMLKYASAGRTSARDAWNDFMKSAEEEISKYWNEF